MSKICCKSHKNVFTEQCTIVTVFAVFLWSVCNCTSCCWSNVQKVAEFIWNKVLILDDSLKTHGFFVLYFLHGSEWGNICRNSVKINFKWVYDPSVFDCWMRRSQFPHGAEGQELVVSLKQLTCLSRYSRATYEQRHSGYNSKTVTTHTFLMTGVSCK